MLSHAIAPLFMPQQHDPNCIMLSCTSGPGASRPKARSESLLVACGVPRVLCSSATVHGDRERPAHPVPGLPNGEPVGRAQVFPLRVLGLSCGTIRQLITSGNSSKDK